MPSARVLPTHFIEFDHALALDRVLSTCSGAAGGDELLWQVRDSVSDLITGPVIISPAIKEGEPIPDALLHNHQVIIVSQRLRETIEPWLKDYEFLPAQIELWNDLTHDPHGGGNLVSGYWWLNSWRRLDVVDWDKTEASRFGQLRKRFSYPRTPVKATAFQKLILRSTIPSGEHFFGLFGVEGEHRYLSPQLHAHLVSQNLRIRFRYKLFQRGSMREGDPEAFEQYLNPHMPRPQISG